MTGIPWAVERRPDTGVTNATLGLWLFLAAEVMFFGSLVSAYALLRSGADGWPVQREVVRLPLGILDTLLLLGATAATLRASRALHTGATASYRGWTGAALALGAAFLGASALEWAGLVARGQVPSASLFAGLFFTLTASHAVHLLGALAVSGYLLGPGAGLARLEPARYAHRVAVTAVYWQFVTAVWLVLVVLLYLL